jgi:4'-phosphopantetheinyl transferase
VKLEGAPRLGPQSVHLWYALSDEAEAEAASRQLLSDEELRRYDRLLLPEARHRFAVAHTLVRSVLSLYADVEPQAWRFSTGPHGKPEIAHPGGLPPLRFNLSHTAGLSACAVTLDRDIGVDVEMTGRRVARMEIARRFFAPQEAAAVEAEPERFFDYWTLKEAYIKATGRGLSMPLREAPSLGEQPPGWHFFRDIPSPRHLCAVAVRAPDDSDLRLTILR